MTKPQTTLKDAKVIRKFGKWTFESFTAPNGNTQYVLCDGWTCNYIIFYENGKFGTDSGVSRKDIREYLYNYAEKF